MGINGYGLAERHRHDDSVRKHIEELFACLVWPFSGSY
jgi:hypothetical protein